MEPGHLVVALDAQRPAGALGVDDVHKLGPENVHDEFGLPLYINCASVIIC